MQFIKKLIDFVTYGTDRLLKFWKKQQKENKISFNPHNNNKSSHNFESFTSYYWGIHHENSYKNLIINDICYLNSCECLCSTVENSIIFMVIFKNFMNKKEI